ncbi:8877_t:CDS:2 [Scutellospora calospora]|uniref:8877_t:CDS:1 n=1 Tax=Scutellospora calospora TaxID=85575 RepID=A0ACA9L6X6_9GLOM|nr:8877_t:CDS:2 [Scutellospora calospora]
MDSEDIMESSTRDTTDKQQVLYRKKSGCPKAALVKRQTKSNGSHLALCCEKVSDYVSNVS